MTEAILKLTDSPEGLLIEGRSSDVNDHESHANIIAGYLARNFDNVARVAIAEHLTTRGLVDIEGDGDSLLVNEAGLPHAQ